MKRAIVLSAFVWVDLCAAQQPRFDGKTWWHHVEVLAADNMEGRGTGSPGLQRAQAYVVDQLQQSGLAPAGTDGYYQPIKFETRQFVESDSSAALVRNGKAELLALGEDAVFVTLVDLAPKVEAPLVFLGYGINVAEKNYNDFAGLDLKGKIAVTIAGLPDGIDGLLATHYQNRDQRHKQFRAAGLIGWIVIVPGSDSTWPSHRRDAAQAYRYLVDDDDTRGLKLDMWFNPAHAGKLFEGSGHTPEELFVLAKDHKPLPRFALPVSILATPRVKKKTLQSANVVAKLEGSDQKLKNEYVVLSAHIDHLGLGEPVNGDRIYNGALDDASGCAVLLDIAAQLKKEGARTRRTILFVFFTGEEGGLQGSKYFTARPTVDAKAIVANINIDPFTPLVPMKALAGQGFDESDLGDAVRRASAAQNTPIDFEPALYPKQFFASASDQASFIMHGVPAVKLLVGFPGDLDAVLTKWRTDVMHKPSDDLKQPVNLETAGKFEEIVLQFLLDVANDPHRPEWKANSFYKRYAAR